MLALRVVVRTLGVAWVAGLATAAWQYTPPAAAVAAPNSSLVSAPAPEVAARPSASPTAGARVVYQGLVMGSEAPQRTAQPAGPAPARPMAVTLGRDPIERQDPAHRAPVVGAAGHAAPNKVARLDEPVPAGVAVAAPRRVDLNTASLDELNGLGGGMVGRAIIAGRPYRSPEDLLAKRVLNKTTFARIRDQLGAQ